MEGLGLYPHPSFLILLIMIHFNELYITEDGKNLVIDTAIDNFAVYNDCFINTIRIQSKTDCKSSDPYTIVFPGDNNDPIDALLQGVLIIVDIDNDGKITYHDEEICTRIYNIIKSLDLDLRYDVNEDGSVNVLDVTDIVAALTNLIPKTPKMDINQDLETNTADINALVDIILAAIQQVYGDEDYELITTYFDLVRNGDSIKQYRYKRIRKCISIKQLALLTNAKTDEDNLFLITVEATVGGNVAAIESLGCGWDTNIIYGLAYNDKKLYDAAVNLAGSYGDNCDNNDASRFVDFILRYYAFIFAIKCGDLDQACYYWNNYLRNNNTKTMFIGGGCGCHGTRR